MATPLPHAAAQVASRPSPLPEAQPRAYTILKSSQLCSHCGSLHESSQIMVRCELPARYGMGASLTQLKALTQAPEFCLPIEVRNLETKRIPFCHECWDATRPTTLHPAISHLPPPPSAESGRIVGLRDPNAGEARGSGSALSRAKVRNADDLLALFD